jgi:hypothetical protein
MTERLVKWIGADSGWKVGRVVNVDGGDDVYRNRQSFDTLVRHAHTGELEWIAESELSTYPSEPIPQP